jgi:hypothetical protein
MNNQCKGQTAGFSRVITYRHSDFLTAVCLLEFIIARASECDRQVDESWKPEKSIKISNYDKHVKYTSHFVSERDSV